MRVSIFGIFIMATFAAASALPAATTDLSPRINSEETAALQAHNTARNEVRTPALTWDTGLAADAKNWANHLADIGALEHSGVSGQGENLYMQGGGDTVLSQAVSSWVSEKQFYHGEVLDENNYLKFGHYSKKLFLEPKRAFLTHQYSSGCLEVNHEGRNGQG
jgi:hypothetical protein